MKTRISILTLIILVLIMSCNSIELKNFNSKKTDSILNAHQRIIEKTSVINERYAQPYIRKDSIFLFGKFPIGKPVVLINNRAGKVFTTFTKYHNVDSIWEAGEQVITGLKENPNKKDFQNFTFADFESNYFGYQLIEIEHITNKSNVDSIDQIIRQSKKFDSAFRYIPDNVYGRPFIKEDLRIIKPQIIKYQHKGSNYNIATYIMNDISGPRFILIKDKILYFNKEPCSWPIYIFINENEIYFESGSYTCMSFVSYFEIFKYKRDTLELIYQTPPIEHKL